jgi:hypothetical protein
MIRTCVSVAAAAIAAAVFAALGAADESRSGERLVSAEWGPYGERRPESRKVQVVWSGHGFGCQYRFHRVASRETERSVTIKVLVHRRAMREGEVCTAIAPGGRGTARLERPLGGRKLRHAPTNDPGG